MSDPYTSFSNCDDDATNKYFRKTGYDMMEVDVDPIGAHIPQSKDYDARQMLPTSRKKIAKVKIMGQENALFTPCLIKNCSISQSVQTFLVKMYGLIPQILQETHRLG